MLPPQANYFVVKELHETYLHTLEQKQMQRENNLPQPYHKAAGWLGGQMVKLGAKLQAYNAEASPSPRIAT